MFKKGEIRQNLLGCLETALFMHSGAKRFSASKDSMKRSFIIPLLALPLTLATVLAAHPHDDLTQGTANILIAIYSLRLALYLGVFLGLVYFFAKNTDRLDSFYRFATANNWLVLPTIVFMAPLVAMFLAGHYSWTDIQPLLVIITLYSYAYMAFMATHVMRVPWELATSLVIAGMAIHQTSLDLLKWAAINAVSLVVS
jgi:hypothetical protein